MAVSYPSLDAAVYRYNETVVASGTSNPLILTGFKDILTRVIPGAGGAKIQFTSDNESVVDAGGATWEDWDSGVVTAVTTRVLESSTAIRLVNADAVNTSAFQVEMSWR